LTNMLGPRAAAAANDLCAGGKPIRSRPAEIYGVARAGPAASLRVPLFAGVGIDEDRLVCGGAEFGNQIKDQRRSRAVDADRRGLRENCDGASAIGEQFAMSDVG